MAPTLSPELLEYDFDKPGASPTTTTTKISVRFVPLLPLELQIKYQPMNTPSTTNDAATHQLAAHLEQFSMPAAATLPAARPAPSKTAHGFHFAAHRPPPATIKTVPAPK